MNETFKLASLDKVRVAKLSGGSKGFRWHFFAHPFDLFEWLKDQNYVWDADVCGDYIDFWVMIDGDRTWFYKFGHEWYVERDPEFNVVNNFEFETVSRESLTGEAKDNLKFVV